ncbi:UDP-GlcNAc:undecaprenyl-phosphate GlcNAc-1-phosphate transferase [Tissierella praeacuta DSM 18095]|uniref:UDP-GlcNAc:undecaprenyl-phosphate GlcNAc-1-phosphate transferase n=1 Tax=Tissierella praeacuta DSM 18095 TaxID=1123404 RepID=A0A1M4WHX4_9FIRM|nr:MraY family glycosyltransferase [Tissierella praeacuta]TCU79066.1 UDP-GlcNAc:undecaprenyl-phosphate GlcNAc-1-phosphate transferase [Tissierella praeacuta]SHE80653.1 UDP-GlcNAc:undecaprenyl-phosphate GlcNAc-1-phosphate transferase [Tissierella praeacuta DSM 18095]SUO99426.1 Phospho-N-acetylmuramoyl-pentapeptide-transferase [Tissierella praeacuta]HAE91988.1 undecaprenyl/decaprenyl-phosphate alpha-N-acetylglucosaminyl 1-phosphate transferase [Tissierella sp.]
MKNFLPPFFLAVVISYLFTPLVRKLAFKIGAVDIPKDDRRVHKEPMPLMGGLAIFLAVVVVTLIFLPLEKEILAILIGGMVIVIGGIIDDLKELRPKTKFIFQIIAGLILIYGDVKVDFITNPFTNDSSLIYLNWLSIPITLFWVVGITNTLNFIDGLDGLSAGVAMISSITLMIVAGKGYTNNYISVIILSSAIAGGCLGFLPFNFNPAKIFMGDTGALFLGFMLAAITIEGVMKSVATIAIVAPILILSVPIFDTTFAIFRRLLNGQSISAADKGHLHHRLLNRGYSQRKSVLILYGISASFGLFAILVSKANSRQAVYLSILLLAASVLVAIKLGIFEKR